MMSTYTKDLAAACCARWDAGETYGQIAQSVDVSPATVARWIRDVRSTRARLANRAAWKDPITDTERERVRDLLGDAVRNEDWSLVEDVRQLLGRKAFGLYEKAQKRGWEPEPHRDGR
ncbi:MAG: hypothetical protein H0U59_10745 [Gemmatimonadaceae bacterium]|nr:hypothetical protein [Gemmatimonadaceae bacterium]